MRDLDAELRRYEGRGRRGVHIAVDDDPVRHLLDQDRLDALHDARGLRRMAQRADLEVDVGLANAEIVEEGAGQRIIVVLARVHDDLVDTSPLARSKDRREFRKVRTCSDHVEKFHHSRIW